MDSAEKQVEIAYMVSQSAATGRIWIGANDKTKEDTWEWIDNSEFDYSNWGVGRPNGDYNIQNTGSDCAHIKSSDYCWNDSPCDLETNYFFCNS